MSMKKKIKDYVGAGLTLGVGNMVLNEIPGSSGIVTGMNKGNAMMGVAFSAGMGGEVLNQMQGWNRKSKRHKRKRR